MLPKSEFLKDLTSSSEIPSALHIDSNGLLKMTESNPSWSKNQQYVTFSAFPALSGCLFDSKLRETPTI